MKNFLPILLMLLTYSYTFSQNGGESVYTFLQLPVSSNSVALGGASISGGNLGANYLFSNAAMIDTLADRYIATNYADYIVDINFTSAAYCSKINNNWSVAAGVVFINYGSFDYANEAGVVDGTFKANDCAIYLSGIRQIVGNLRGSVTYKTIVSHLEHYHSWGIAFDFGLVYKFEPLQLTIAATANNVGFQCKPYINGNREPLPLTIQMGVSKLLLYAPLKFSLMLNQLQSRLDQDNATNIANHFVFGVELFPQSVVSVKGGFNVQRHNDLRLSNASKAAGFSFGADVKLRKFAVQYSRSCYGAAANINMFSVELFLRQWHTVSGNF